MISDRRRFLSLLLSGAVAAPFTSLRADIKLAKDVCFRGEERFRTIAAKAIKEGWARLPMGQRMVTVARELAGTPYVGYTLEIDDKIECPSCNFDGLDCWTFFETVLGIARMVETPKPAYTWQDLLAEIEWTRYRGGKCTGGYLERLHYLDEWFFDNFARQNVHDLTRRLPGAIALKGRKSTEMTNLWKSYRYLKKNPELRPPMRELEEAIERLPIRYVPKSGVAAIEGQLQSGDIVGIVTNQQGGVCSHVGLAVRAADGVLHFMHASKNHHQVLIDKQLSAYLHDFGYHAGIMVARPLPVSLTVRDEKIYRSRLDRLKAGLTPN